MVAVAGNATHPFVPNGWKEGAIVLEWEGDRTLGPCEKIEASKEDRAATRDLNSSFAGQIGFPGWGAALEDQALEDWNPADSEQLGKTSLESQGLGTAGHSLYVTEAGQLSDDGLLLCLGETRIKVTGRAGGDCEGKDSSEWCAAKVFPHLCSAFQSKIFQYTFLLQYIQ